jgi:acyl-CoA synthetase (AMP-forming)/AMP-acid ligase II
MTEASPVTHMGFLSEKLYKPDSVGAPVALTDCRVVDENENDVAQGQLGELVMRGPQFMLGYWKAPDASAAVLRDGWYWSGDIVRVDEDGFYYVVDRRKEMIKYKGFSIAPAEVESVLLECPKVRDCGVVSRTDADGEEIPCAFVVLTETELPNQQTVEKLQSFVAERLTNYKMPREIFLCAIVAPHRVRQDPASRVEKTRLRTVSSSSLNCELSSVEIEAASWSCRNLKLETHPATYNRYSPCMPQSPLHDPTNPESPSGR